MKRTAVIWGAVLTLLLIITIVVSYNDETKDWQSIIKYSDGDLLQFSEPQSFHSKDISLRIHTRNSVPKSAQIYYTLDGDDPTAASALYEGAIELKAGASFRAVAVRAVAIYNGESSAIYTKTYFLCSNIGLLSKELNIVSVVSDSYGLFDYDKGILVNGRVYDEFMASDKAKDTPIWNIPANFKIFRGREYERISNVEIFNGAGERSVSQTIGLTVTGGVSSFASMKTLKLVARKAYDEHNSKLRLDLFNYKDIPGSAVSLYPGFDRLVLRNGGQDRNRSYIKWNISSGYARDAGIFSTAPVTPAAVFLNGGYYGMSNIQPTYSRYYFSKTFDLEEENIYEYGTSERLALTDTGLLEYVRDLESEENMQALENMLDMDDMLLYYAFQMTVNSTDWPGNNYKLWMYAGAQKEGNKYSDNRYRPLLYDLDSAYMGKDEAFDLLLGEYDSQLIFLRNVVKNERYRDKLINLFNDLLATVFRPENALGVLEEENAKFAAYENSLVLGDLVKTGVSENRAAHVEDIRGFINGREPVIRENLKKHFGVSEVFTLEVEPPPAGNIILWSSLSLYDDSKRFSGTYYTGVPVEISAAIDEGSIFSHWVVNGEEIFDLSFLPNEYADVHGSVEVELCTLRKSEGVIVINEVSAASLWDWIELYNAGLGDVFLGDYFISDDYGNLQRCRLPDFTLGKGEYLVLECKNSYKLFSYIINFNISAGETIYISDRRGNILQKMIVPQMSEEESYGRYRNTADWLFFSSPSPGG